MYKHPGVYIEHVPSGLLAVEAASTSVAAIIGPVKRGTLVTDDKEDGKPVFVSSQAQFARMFGELDGAAGGLRNMGALPDAFGHAVQAFFANGGTKAYVVPVGDGAGAAAAAAFTDPANAGMGFYFTARSEGVWANGMVLRITRSVPDENPLLTTYDVRIGLPDGRGGLDPVLETHTDLTLDPSGGQFLASAVDAASELVSARHAGVASSGGGAVTGFISGDLSGLDPTTVVAGETLDVSITGVDSGGGGPFFTVTFAGTADTLVELVAEIQEQARADSNIARAGFVATATRDGRILLLPGRSDIAGRVHVVSVPGGSAAATLAFDAGSAVDYPSPWPDPANPLDATFAGGVDHGAPQNADYTNALIHLRDYRDVSILLLPGRTWISGGDNGAIEAAIGHAEFMKNRMVLVDPPDPVGPARLQSPADVKALGAPTSPYAALYYPWLEVANPFHDPDTAANLPRTFRVPPGAFAAGVWARIDARRGVWKAPAGLEATVRGAVGPTIDIGADLQDNLNEFGVNCLRAIIGPVVVWGARTRATKTQPEFRYVPVRRTQNMIGESLYGALQAVVFEPNDHRLWASLRANVGAFMDTLHRAGAFQGEKASDAWYVQCGLGSTMTQADIDAGVVRVVVGFAPLKPAEFVVVQIKQIVGQTA